MSRLRGLRIAVVTGGDPSDPAAYSGGPAALLGGLRDLGVDAVPVGGSLDPAREKRIARPVQLGRLRPSDLRDIRGALAREHAQAHLGARMTAARQGAVGARLAAETHLDGVISYGAELVIPGDLPVVTYEDATFPLAQRTWRWKHLEGARPSDLAFYTQRQREAYGRARACCTTSEWAADSVVADQDQSPDRVHVVGVGAVHAYTSTAAERDWSRPRFLFVGLDWPRKNGPRVLDAFQRLRAEYPHATLDVVSGHPDIDQPGVTTHGLLRITDPSERARYDELFAHATCFVMPSLHEPAGFVFAEAISAGIPAIGTTNGGSASIIGDAGEVVDPLNDQSILDAMRRMTDPATLQDLHARAARRAPLLTWSAVAGRLIRALQLPHIDEAQLPAFLS